MYEFYAVEYELIMYKFEAYCFVSQCAKSEFFCDFTAGHGIR